MPHPTDPALDYFHEVVEPTVAEFMTNKADRRRGVLACLALASMTEHYFHARPALGMTLAAFKGAIRQPAPAGRAAVGWIADIANATKHVARQTKPDGTVSKPGYEDVRVRHINTAGIMRAGWPLGGTEVLVGPNMEGRLSALVEATMSFWRDKLGLSVASSRPKVS